MDEIVVNVVSNGINLYVVRRTKVIWIDGQTWDQQETKPKLWIAI